MKTRTKFKKADLVCQVSDRCRILRGAFGWIVLAQGRNIGEVEFLADAEELAAREDARIAAQREAREARDRETLAELRETLAETLAEDAAQREAREARDLLQD